MEEPENSSTPATVPRGEGVDTGAQDRATAPGLGVLPGLDVTQGPGASPAPAAAPETELERWIALFRGPLVGLLRARGAGRDAAVELAQETFAEAWCGAERFRGDRTDEGAVGRWLTGIARNLHRSRARAHAAGPRALDVEAVPEPAAPTPGEAEGERRAALHAALERLTPEHREVVWMHYLEETPVRQVAALLETTEKTVEGRLYRARIELRRILDTTAEGGGTTR